MILIQKYPQKYRDMRKKGRKEERICSILLDQKEIIYNEILSKTIKTNKHVLNFSDWWIKNKENKKIESREKLEIKNFFLTTTTTKIRFNRFFFLKKILFYI